MENRIAYRVVFDWTLEGSELLYMLQPVMEEYYLMVYNEFVNEVNPYYEQWNEEAEALGLNGSVDPDSDYMMFIRNKQTAVLDRLVLSSKKCVTTAADGSSMIHYIGKEDDTLHCKMVTSIGSLDVTFHLVEDSST